MMEEDLDQAMRVEVLAARLRMEGEESGDLLESLASKLEQSLPENTAVTRGGWVFSKEHPVQEITVRFEENEYHLARGKGGGFIARVRKSVRGVVLKTAEIPIDQWTEEVAGELAKLAEHNIQTRRALKKFVTG